MAYEEALTAISRPAGVDLDGANDKYTGVKLNGSAAVVKFAAITDAPFGVLQDAPKAGDPARVAISGVSKVRAGAAIGAGVEFSFSAAGLAVPAASTSYVVGTTLSAAGSSGEIISAVIDPISARIKA
ncbi:RecA-like DNA recombinase [Arthrobacter phage Edmundo]|nr:RecA-like DNA recombinase [Arthrobacter phage Edmundo]